MRKIVITMLAALVAVTARAANVEIDVPAIAGMDKTAVQKILGAPQKCAPTKHGQECSYAAGKAEIVFIKGAADWLTLHVDAPFSAAALERIGFQIEKPDLSNEHVIRWNAGMRFALSPPPALRGTMKPGETYAMPIEEISIFPSGSKAFYIYVRVSTR